MKLDKNKAVIKKLVAAACAPVKYEKNVTVEEAVLQLITTPSEDPKGHTKTDCFRNLKRLLFSESEIEMALHDLEQAEIIRIYSAHGPTFGGAVVHYRLTLDFMTLMADYTGQKGRQTLADMPKPNDVIQNATVKLKPDAPWFVEFVNMIVADLADPQYVETIIMQRLVRAEHINWNVERLADVLVQQFPMHTKDIYVRTIEQMIQDELITRYPEGGIRFSSQFNMYTQVILDTVRGKNKSPDLLSVNIKIKGNNVTLKELYFFYRNMHWLFETQKHLEYIYVGHAKLSKAEAEQLHQALTQQGAFD